MKTFFGKRLVFLLSICFTLVSCQSGGSGSLSRLGNTLSKGGGDSNVRADWKFEETSTQIVDSVNGITLTENPNAGIPKDITYLQNISGTYSSFNPCVKYGSVSDNHEKLSNTRKLRIRPNNHFVFEWLAEKSVVHFPDYHFSSNGGSNVNDWGVMAFSRSATQLDVWIKANDGTAVSNTFTVSDVTVEPSFYQLYCDRTDSCELFQDQVSRGSMSITSLAGKRIRNRGFRMGGQFNGGSESFDGLMCRFRISIGNNVLSNSLL